MCYACLQRIHSKCNEMYIIICGCLCEVVAHGLDLSCLSFYAVSKGNGLSGAGMPIALHQKSALDCRNCWRRKCTRHIVVCIAKCCVKNLHSNLHFYSFLHLLLFQFGISYHSKNIFCFFQDYTPGHPDLNNLSGTCLATVSDINCNP